SLTPREREVLLLVAEGATNIEIAARLGIGRETVKTLVYRAFDKLGVKRRGAAARPPPAAPGPDAVTTLDRELRRELAAAFAADAPARLEELAAALERLVGGAAGARDDAARQAHALRGAAATVGDQALAGLCASIEELLAEEPADLEEVAAALRLVERERDRLGASRGAPAPAAGRRPLPSSFAGRVAVLAAVAIVPALGIAVYDAVHGRSSARAQAQAELRRDVNLVAGAERQALDGAAVVLGLAAGAEEARHAPSPACDRL